MGINYDKSCVCFSELLGECLAIAQGEFYKGHKCDKCPFHKTKEEYFRQTGRTYNEEIMEAKYYDRMGK